MVTEKRLTQIFLNSKEPFSKALKKRFDLPRWNMQSMGRGKKIFIIDGTGSTVIFDTIIKYLPKKSLKENLYLENITLPSALTLEFIKKTSIKDVYYFGSLDPISLLFYHAFSHDFNLKKTKKQLNIKWVGINPSDVRELPKSIIGVHGQVFDRKKILEFIAENELVDDLPEHVEFLKKTGAEPVMIALAFHLYDAIQRKGVLIKGALNKKEEEQIKKYFKKLIKKIS
ncbi:MAG: hypothetical protein GOU97_01850 [Nanoarchaeota archaeon]|nr:hypothetical protein [Nanoarchaeota archaeon]